MPDFIYLDHAATTPIDPRVREVMTPYLDSQFGNASSVHRLGRRARFVVEECRERVADAIGAEPGEIIFTSGGTEADNLAIKGALMAASGGHLITSAAEHEAVLRPAEAHARRGEPLTLLEPDPFGRVTAGMVENALEPQTTLVSLMHANNEVGTLTAVREIAALCREAGVAFHTDAVQTMGLLRVDVGEMGVDLLSASAHKIYGPKGAGFLFVRGGVELAPLIEGGAQERRRRGGTENVAGIVGLTEALTLAIRESDARRSKAEGLRRHLLAALDAALDGIFRLSTPRDPSLAVPNIVNVHFPPVDGATLDGEMLLLNLDMEGVLVSAGSACTSGAMEPSHVLRAMGIEDRAAQAAVRFSFGKDTTEQELTLAVERLAGIVRRIRKRAVAS